MFVIIGSVVVIAGVVGGFVIEGGPPLVLIQPVEFHDHRRGGDRLHSDRNSAQDPQGAGRRTSPPPLGRGSLQGQYLELLTALYEIFINAKKNGFIASTRTSATRTRADLLQVRYTPEEPPRARLPLRYAQAAGGRLGHTDELEDMLDADIETTTRRRVAIRAS